MTKHSHRCQNELCDNTASKDKYGNYRAYCSTECKVIGRLNKFKETYANKDTDAILAKRRATVTDRYGVDNVSKTAGVKAQLKITTAATADIRTRKTKETNLKNHGVESTNSLQAVKDLKKSNYKEKTGFDHQLKDPTIAAKVSAANTKNADKRLAKAAETNLEKYGCINPSSNTEVKQKRTDTMIERFGVENASQNAEVHAKKMKSQYRNKEFVFPSGRKEMVMGYEPLAIAELLQTYAEDDIVLETTKIPRISYIGIDGITHYYFPDIYIPKDNLLIEVKSLWTYSGYPDWLTTNFLKQQGSINAGYNFKFMIMNKARIVRAL